MRRIAAWIAPIMFLTASLHAGRPFDAAGGRPNVILIMTDDQGMGDMGVMGNTVLRTPQIDRLAGGGAWVTRFYVSPVCTPTRASLMTGRWNYRTRAIDTYVGRAMMDPAEVTVAEVLRDAGYATGIFGKWHLGDSYPLRSMDQGFDESLVIKGGGLRQPSNPPDGDTYFNPILMHNGKPVRKEGFCTDIYFDAALGFIESQHKAGKPFFAYIPTNAPHDPFDEVPKKEYAYYKDKAANDRDARIFAMVANIDQNIGRLLDKLDAIKAAENTVVIYMHDNGPAGKRFNAGLRGTKGQVYEGGIRSPFFVRWPKMLDPGIKVPLPAAHIDVMPTILAACGVPSPRDAQLDGINLLPWMMSDAQPPPMPQRTLFFQWHRGNEPVMYHCFAAVTRRWKLLAQGNSGQEKPTDEPKFQLYDLLNDSGESKDVAAEHSEIIADLKGQYEAWFKDVGSTRADNYAPPRIVVGSERANPVTLTFQDIRVGGQREGWWSNGHWSLQVVSPHRYSVRLRLNKPLETAATVALVVNGQSRELPLSRDGGGVTFEAVELPQGDVDLGVRITLPDGKFYTGLYQVDVAW